MEVWNHFTFREDINNKDNLTLEDINVEQRILSIVSLPENF